jgi:hypothetical protein
MEHKIDSITTYAVVVFTSGYAWLIDSSNDIMALGGIALLGVRLYTDIRKLRKAKDE